MLDDVEENWFEREGDAVYSYTHWLGHSLARRQALRGDRASGARLLDRLVLVWRGGKRPLSLCNGEKNRLCVLDRRHAGTA